VNLLEGKALEREMLLLLSLLSLFYHPRLN
jgi:hypothetical protein